MQRNLADAPGAQLGDGLDHPLLTCFCPPRQRHLAVTGVNRDDHTLAVLLECLGEKRRIAQRRSADHDSLGAGIEDGSHGLGIAQATADLDRAIDRGRDPPHGLQVLRLPCLRPVEIDDVQELGPFLGPALRRVGRIGVVRRLALVVALQQPHRLAAADVDCG